MKISLSANVFTIYLTFYLYSGSNNEYCHKAALESEDLMRKKPQKGIL